MHVTIDPHGRLPLPSPLRELLAGQRIKVAVIEHPNGSITLHLGKPDGLFGPSQPGPDTAADGQVRVETVPGLPEALLDLVHDHIEQVAPADLITGPASATYVRRAPLTMTRTFARRLADLDPQQVVAAVDVALASAQEPAHPSVDITVTTHPEVFCVSAADLRLTFTRTADRTPIWLTLARR